MRYQRLEFSQYFVDTSKDRNRTGRLLRHITYKSIPYECSRLEEWVSFQHTMNYEIHYEASRDVIQIHFEKTSGGADWYANIFEFAARYYDAILFEGKPLQLRVHYGWANMYRAAKSEIHKEWKYLKDRHPKAYTEIIGWSLGSALAMLCCQDLNYRFGIRPYVYTFGSVRPFYARLGERKRMRRYLSGLYRECWNFADNNDMVSYLPPFPGYMMIHRVTVGNRQRSLKKLLEPEFYHVRYDRQELYRGAEEMDSFSDVDMIQS